MLISKCAALSVHYSQTGKARCVTYMHSLLTIHSQNVLHISFIYAENLPQQTKVRFRICHLESQCWNSSLQFMLYYMQISWNSLVISRNTMKLFSTYFCPKGFKRNSVSIRFPDTIHLLRRQLDFWWYRWTRRDTIRHYINRLGNDLIFIDTT